MQRRDLLLSIAASFGSYLAGSGVSRAAATGQLMHAQMSDGASIALEQGGAGPSLLLVHGSGAFRKSWVLVEPLLQPHFQTCAMDRRGHGDSSDGSTYSLAREAEDIARVAETLPQPVFVLGHSFGAIATLEALRLTDRVERAVLYEPPIPVAGGIGHASPQAVCAKVAAGDREGALLTFFRDYVRLPEPLIERLRADPSWAERVRLAPTLCRESTIVSTYVFEPQRFAALRTPTLFLLGSASPVQMATSVRTVAAGVPHSRLQLLAGQQHDAMFTAPGLLARTVGDFALG